MSATDIKFHIEGGRNLILDGQKLKVLDQEIAEKISSEYPKLSSLSLNLLKLKEVKQWPTLTECVSLSLRDNRLSLENVPLAALETAMPMLRRLDVGGNRLHVDPEKFASALAPLKNLRIIDILGLDVDAAKALAKICFRKCSSNLSRVAGVNREGNIEDSDGEDEEDYEEEEESYGLNSLIGEEEISSDSADFAPEDVEDVEDDEDDELEDDDDDDDHHQPVDSGSKRPLDSSGSVPNNKKSKSE